MVTIKKKTQTILIILMIIFLLAALVCGYKIFGIVQQYHKDQAAYNEISAGYAKKAENNSTYAPPVFNAKEEEEDQNLLHEPSPLEIDFESLQTDVNSEIIGWIYCADTKPEINYPIVHHTDDSYYLNHNAKGNYTAAGAIFMGSSNFSNFSDRNTVIHGHHLYDGSMFGNLGKWEDQEYFDTHNVFYINTPTRNYKVEMIAYFVTPANGQAYTIDFRGDEDVEDWVNWVLSQSAVESGYEYKEGDRFVTLSTCMYNYADARGVLIGHMIPLA